MILFKESPEEKELDEYIFTTQIEDVMENYANGIMQIIFILLIVCSCLIALYFITGLSDTKPGWNFIIQVSYFIGYLIICYLILQCYPSMTFYLIPFGVCTTWFVTVNI
jgi:hypothetical protein